MYRFRDIMYQDFQFLTHKGSSSSPVGPLLSPPGGNRNKILRLLPNLMPHIEWRVVMRHFCDGAPPPRLCDISRRRQVISKLYLEDGVSMSELLSQNPESPLLSSSPPPLL